MHVWKCEIVESVVSVECVECYYNHNPEPFEPFCAIILSFKLQLLEKLKYFKAVWILRISGFGILERHSWCKDGLKVFF